MALREFEQAIGTVGIVLLDRLRVLGKAIRAETDGIGQDDAATNRLEALRQEETRARAELALHLADVRAVYRQADEGHPRLSSTKRQVPF